MIVTSTAAAAPTAAAVTEKLDQKTTPMLRKLFVQQNQTMTFGRSMLTKLLNG